MDTTALLHAAADGDTAAWDALVERYNGLVWAVVRGLPTESPTTPRTRPRRRGCDSSRSSATSATPRASAPGWQPRRGTSACASSASGSATCSRTAFDLPDEDALSALDAGLLTRERDSALWRAFAKLGARCQALLRLLIADPPPSYDEISAALDMPVGSIGPTRGRCLERLRENVAATGITTASGSS
jgi:DNA-directed RNA polymerase specialized sigma24 family protein